MKIAEIGLGSALQALLASLDGGVQQLYEAEGERFRPRFYPIVPLLLEHPSLRVGELASRCGVSQPAMTQTLMAMRREGIVQVVDGKDHRERLISLTAEGLTQARRLERLWAATGQAAARLEAECDAPLTALLGRLLTALEDKPFIERIGEEME